MTNFWLDLYFDHHPVAIVLLIVTLTCLCSGLGALLMVWADEIKASRAHKLRMAVVRKRRGW